MPRLGILLTPVRNPLSNEENSSMCFDSCFMEEKCPGEDEKSWRNRSKYTVSVAYISNRPKPAAACDSGPEGQSTADVTAPAPRKRFLPRGQQFCSLLSTAESPPPTHPIIPVITMYTSLLSGFHVHPISR